MWNEACMCLNFDYKKVGVSNDRSIIFFYSGSEYGDTYYFKYRKYHKNSQWMLWSFGSVPEWIITPYVTLGIYFRYTI